MRTFLKAFLVFIAWFCIAFLYLSSDASSKFKTFLNDLNINQSEVEKISDVAPISQEIIEEIPLKPEKNDALLHISDKAGEVLFSLDSVNIIKNSDSVFFKPSNENYFEPLIAYLSKNDNVEIIINSEYSATENFDTPNIGQKRGDFLIKEFSKLGVNPYILSVKSIIREIEFDENNSAYGVLSFQVKPLDDERKKEIESKSIISQIVYPTFTFSKIIANQELKDYSKELRQLFETNPNRKAKIIGHTDNIGSAVDNYQQGLKYAQQVRWYLINREGFDPTRLNALSEGESNPIDDNNTQTGRKNNLRIEFIIE
ncbi:MAG: OmpA family protein [Flavobacteriaceae bacterium]|nr:OmpA family protein [Flavobacteriaceae bacterium]